MTEHQFHVTAADAQQRLDIFLTMQFSHQFSRTFIKRLLDQKHAAVNGVNQKANYRIEEGDTLSVSVPEAWLVPEDIRPEAISLDILYEDEDLIVVHKPAGMLVHPAPGVYTGTLVNALLHHCEQLSDFQKDPLRPGIVHRLDQETSGVIIAAKKDRIHGSLAKQFKKHKIQKEYIALVEGQVVFDEGQIDAPIGRDPAHRDRRKVSYDPSAKDAFTQYRVLKRNAKASQVLLFPKTGRTHQLRVHMKHLKHPILGDDKYGQKKNFPRLALHAKSIQFYHAGKEDTMTCVAPVPAEFERFFD